MSSLYIRCRIKQVVTNNTLIHTYTKKNKNHKSIHNIIL